MKIKEFQNLIKDIYLEKDKKRGVDKTFIWFIEEVGELARVLHRKNSSQQEIEEEFADCMAWLISLANLKNIDIEKTIINKYQNRCPRCKNTPCSCKEN